MKKIALFLAIVMTAATLAACSDDTPDTNTNPSNGSSSPAATSDQATPDATSEATTADTDDDIAISTPTETTEETEDSTTPPVPDEDPGYPDEDVVSLTVGKAGDTDLKGYDAAGLWDNDENGFYSDSNNSMFIVTNDRMSAGKLTANFTSLEGSEANDNGIIFGMEEMTEDGAYWFWEEPYYAPRYYFLFVSDAGTLYLAKVAYNGNPWTVCQVSEQIIGYGHGGTVTISVEFDGNGTINCYANDELLIEYKDTDPLTGDRYGIRCEVPGVVYHEVIAEHAE